MTSCWRLSVAAKHRVDVAVAKVVKVSGVSGKACVVGSDLSLCGCDCSGDWRKSLNAQTNLSDLGDAGGVTSYNLDSHVAALALTVNLGGKDNNALSAGLADALAIKLKSGRDGYFESSSGGGSPVDRCHFFVG